MKQNNPKIIGLVGGSGAGKSTLAKWLMKKLDAHIIEGDQIGHALLNEPDIIASIQENFPEDVVTDGSVDRKKLGKIVFRDQKSLLRLNHIMHPALKAQISQIIERTEKPYIILDAAVMYEAHLADLVDYMIRVIADDKVKLDRLTKYRQIPREKAMNMINLAQNTHSSDESIVDTTIDLSHQEDTLLKLLEDIKEALRG